MVLCAVKKKFHNIFNIKYTLVMIIVVSSPPQPTQRQRSLHHIVVPVSIVTNSHSASWFYSPPKIPSR